MPTNQSSSSWLKFFDALFIKGEFIGHFDKNRTMLMSMNVSGFHKLGRSEPVMKDFLSKLPLEVKTKFLKKYYESSAFVPSPPVGELGMAGLLENIPREDQAKVLKNFFFNGIAKGGNSWLTSLAAHVEDGSLFGHVTLPVSEKPAASSHEGKAEEGDLDGSTTGKLDHLVITQHQSTTPSGVSFYRVIGQVSPRARFFTKAEASKQYPASGSIVVLAKVASHPFKEDSLVCWAVGEADQTQNSHYNATRPVSEYRIYVVHAMPFKLEQVDLIRESLIDFYTKTNFRNQLFRTKDGAFIRPHFSAAPVVENNFSTPLQVFRKVTTYSSAEFGEVAWDFSGAQVEKLSFISGSLLLKRFLRQSEVREKIKKTGLTNDIVSELAEELETFSAEYAEPTNLARVKDILLHLGKFTEAASEVEAFILNSAEFKQKLDQYIDDSKSKIDQELSGVKSEIKRKLEERDDLERSLANERRAHQKVVKELESAIAKKFREAVSRGKDVLVESALFQALLSNPGPAVATRAEIVPQPIVLPSPEISIKSMEDLSRQVEPFAELLGMETGEGAAFLGALLGCRNVVIDSDRPAMLSRAIATSFFGGVYLDITLPGDVFSISDLLNLPASLHGVSTGPLSLGGALDQLSACEQPILLSVRGMNRAPEGVGLAEIREWTGRHGDGGLEISFTNTRKVIEKIRLPANLFVLFFVDHGGTSIPISPGLLAQLPLFTVSAQAPLGEEDRALLMEEVLGELNKLVRAELRRKALLNKGPAVARERLTVHELIKQLGSIAGVNVDGAAREDVFVSETMLGPLAEKVLKGLALPSGAPDSRAQALFDSLTNDGGAK